MLKHETLYKPISCKLICLNILLLLKQIALAKISIYATINVYLLALFVKIVSYLRNGVHRLAFGGVKHLGIYLGGMDVAVSQ